MVVKKTGSMWAVANYLQQVLSWGKAERITQLPPMPDKKAEDPLPQDYPVDDLAQEDLVLLYALYQAEFRLQLSRDWPTHPDAPKDIRAATKLRHDLYTKFVAGASDRLYCRLMAAATAPDASELLKRAADMLRRPEAVLTEFDLGVEEAPASSTN